MSAVANPTDILVIGAGIAGASIAARLAGKARVTILEMEDQPGYHTSGRSAATYEPVYGPAPIRALTRASGDFMRSPPEGFAAAPLLTPMGFMALGESGDDALVAQMLAVGMQSISFAEAKLRHPLLREGAAEAYLVDDTTFELDVDALLRGFLAQHRRTGGTVVCKAPVERAERRGGIWRATTPAGEFQAPLIVDAAGAWADDVATRCGLGPLGLVPKRRSVCIVAPPPGIDVRAMPLIANLRETFYARRWSGKQIISPADAEPTVPHDAYADDLRLAEAIDTYQRFVEHEVTRIERSWGGLRTFAADGDPVIGFDPRTEGFFWSAGQGGYGMQTAPAWSALAAALLLGEEVPAGIAAEGIDVAALSPARFA